MCWLPRAGGRVPMSESERRFPASWALQMFTVRRQTLGIRESARAVGPDPSRPPGGGRATPSPTTRLHRRAARSGPDESERQADPSSGPRGSELRLGVASRALSKAGARGRRQQLPESPQESPRRCRCRLACARNGARSCSRLRLRGHSLCGALVRCGLGEVGDKAGEPVGLVDHRERSRVLDHFEPTIG